MIVVMSLWRNDADRNLRERAAHLLSKTSTDHEVAFLWAVGDCVDDTYSQLIQVVNENYRSKTIIVVNADTGIIGEDVDTRRRRSSSSATQMFHKLGHYYPDADYVLLHESDLQSPPDVVDRLLRAGNGSPCAGWPVIDVGNGPQFYDTWAYSYRNGRYFTAAETHPGIPFQVRSFGSVWIAPLQAVRDRKLYSFAIRELCDQWWEEGVEMFCDPNTVVVQPTSLWSPS